MSRSHALVVFVVLGLSAGLAFGGWMLAGKPGEERVPEWVPLAESRAPVFPARRDGERILRGNLFAWSETPVPGSVGEVEPSPCEGLRLVGTFVEHGARGTSVALIGAGAGITASREGERVSAWNVGRIDTLAVDLERDGGHACRLWMFAQRTASDAPPHQERPPAEAPPRSSALGARRLGDGRWSVERERLFALLTRPPAGLRVIPSPRGVRLVGADRVLGTVGLEPGDVVRRVGGHPVTDADAMLAFWARRDTLERLELELLRDGELLRHEYVLE